MKNIRQIQTISGALHLERQRFMSELIKANLQIQKKLTVIAKIVSYQEEYTNGKSLQISRAVPALHKNLSEFSKNITKLIAAEEIEINKLALISKALSERIRNIDRKIELMSIFENRIHKETHDRNESNDQRLTDDMVTRKSSEKDS
jgi:flagellar biosynthesis chaperone FliJ